MGALFTPELAAALLPVTEAAAIVQSGPSDGDEPEEAERRLQAAIEAMHAELLRAGLRGRLVAGKGFGLKLRRLFTGERLEGRPESPALDFAADPVEGTSAEGAGGNAVAVLAATREGCFLDPGPAFYMEKLVAPPAATGALDPAAPLERRLAALAEALGKRVGELRIAVLEKPRHRALVAAITRSGATLHLSLAGDVALALQAALPEGPFDALMGTGGFAEGLMAAAAARALGAVFHGRFDPQLQSERLALARSGRDTQRWHGLEELVASADTLFIATGIRGTGWLGGVERGPCWLKTESFALTGPGALRTRLQRVHDVAAGAGLPC